MLEKKKNEAKCKKQKEVQALDDVALESAAGGVAPMNLNKGIHIDALQRRRGGLHVDWKKQSI